MIDIKFIPTGHIFSLSDSEAERIVKEDRGNYEVIKGKIKEDKAPKAPKTVQELVVVDDKDKETKTNNKNSNKTKDNENKPEDTTESETETK